MDCQCYVVDKKLQTGAGQNQFEWAALVRRNSSQQAVFWYMGGNTKMPTSYRYSTFVPAEQSAMNF
jgi:hypothetical protein